jgi:hypothetical protein
MMGYFYSKKDFISEGVVVLQFPYSGALVTWYVEIHSVFSCVKIEVLVVVRK